MGVVETLGLLWGEPVGGLQAELVLRYYLPVCEEPRVAIPGGTLLHQQGSWYDIPMCDYYSTCL